MQKELKPCPFCGEKDDVKLMERDDGGCFVMCYNCITATTPVIPCASEELAVEAWNRRADGWRDAKTDPPDDYEAVNVVWVNRDPPSYYAHEKDVPHVGTAHYMDKVRGWYWESPVCYDMLAEYGDSITDRVADGIDIIFWMPLPEPPGREE